MTAIRVAHSGAEYDVIVGGVADAMPRLAGIANGQLLPLITDKRVYQLFGGLVAGIAMTDPILVPEGESAKDWTCLVQIVEQLALSNIKRGTPIVALGGGSVGDVAGLAASLFKRGCPIIHVPTTFLAQADSAIGGKTAIDAAGQKNLVGTFHHPALVIADPAMLDSLDARQLRSGYAEAVKYGLIDDSDFFAWCEKNGAEVLLANGKARRTAIEHCVRAKARFVTADPSDDLGTRALLNLGHTFGHAIEALAGGTILHGEAVAAGTCLAFDYSAQLGLCPFEDAIRVRRHFAGVGLPTALTDSGLAGRWSDLLTLMARDKKASPAGLKMVLTRGIGRAFLQSDVDGDSLAEFLRGEG